MTAKINDSDEMKRKCDKCDELTAFRDIETVTLPDPCAGDGIGRVFLCPDCAEEEKMEQRNVRPSDFDRDD